MPIALQGAFESEFEPETLEQLRIHASVLRHAVEKRMAWLDTSRPRRHRTALKVLAANARVTAAIIGMLQALGEYESLVASRPRPGQARRVMRELLRRIERLAAFHQADAQRI